jgi:hypothetical protein
LLRDVLQLHAVIHHLGRTSPSVATAFATPNDDDDDKKPNTADPNHKNKTLDDDDHLSTLASRIYRLIVDGKPYELAGLKDVPKPFFRSPGRCLARDGAMRYQVLSERDAHAAIVVLLRHEFQRQDLVGWEQQAPYKDFRTAMASSTAATVGIVPDPKDAIVLNVADGNGDKLYESQGGNKAIFNLASQLVTSYTNDSEKRVEAALAIMKGLREAEVIEEDKESKTTTVVASNTSRYLLRTPRNDDTITWSILDAAAAAEFTVIFVLEIFLEKGIHLLPPGEVLGSAVALDKTMVKPSTEPVPDPTDYDVLFGRGGMTNSHPGNRRFRDVIALHRPDYIRAIKMDKPGVARKIVQAIRTGIPPGRYVRWKLSLYMCARLYVLTHRGLPSFTSADSSKRTTTASGTTWVIAPPRKRRHRACGSVPTPKNGSGVRYGKPCASDARTWLWTVATPIRRPKSPTPTWRPRPPITLPFSITSGPTWPFPCLWA